MTCVVQDPLAADVTVLRVRGPNPEESVACGPLVGSWNRATTPPDGAGQCDPLTVTLWPTTSDVELRRNSAPVPVAEVADADEPVRGAVARAAGLPAVEPPQPATPSATKKSEIRTGPPAMSRGRIAYPSSAPLSPAGPATTAPHGT